MFRILLPVAALGFVALGFAIQPALASGKLPKPDRVPEAPSSEQAALVREGLALHDRRNFEGAIAKYKQVLAQNPWEVTALHELAAAYFESKDYQHALDTARLGAQCRSENLAGFYSTIGNALDELGRGSEAIDTYRAAIKLNPRMSLLYYDLAISLRRAGRLPEAKAAVQRAIECNPDHAFSHALLGAIYQDMGYRIPAILAYSRFLVLEPETARSPQIATTTAGLLKQGVNKGAKPNEFTISISETSKNHKDEGDFTSAQMALCIVLAGNLVTKPEDAGEPPKSSYRKLVSLYASLGESLDNLQPKSGFAAAYYAPYFAALATAEHTEAFAAYAWKAGNVDGASDWAPANQAKIEAFLAWSKAYQWPEK